MDLGIKLLPLQHNKYWKRDTLQAACLGGVMALSVLVSKPLAAAGFLAPLPVQDLTVGERYSIGIRPSRAPARRTATSKIDLYAEGLSNGASFRMVGDEIWELVWFPSPVDKGVHMVRILVTERGRPNDVIEVQELTFVINGARVTESADVPLVAAAAPLTALATVNLDESGTNDIIVVAAEENIELLASESDASSRLSKDSSSAATPDWTLSSIASRVVTPHQWVRFPVTLISDSTSIDDYVTLQVDQLPNGASFDKANDGSRHFQWRPGTADSGEHVLNFTAIDTKGVGQSQTVTMRIIVQE